jgi:hypothetical protein
MPIRIVLAVAFVVLAASPGLSPDTGAQIRLDPGAAGSGAQRAGSPRSQAEWPAMGPLRVHPTNPRYFADPEGRAVYLTGSHNWNSLQDRGKTDPPPAFDFDAYLDVLVQQGHNFIRLWAWEQAEGAPWTTDRVVFRPLAYERTGPGTARDGHPRFDVTRFNQAYFDRLRSRVVAARARGLYVSVMLFEGWSIDSKGKRGNPWPGHPFHRDNNVNGIDGDPSGNGQGEETHTLAVPAITALQRAHVRKVVDTLNDLDNVLWEISNESHVGSTAWQYEMIRTLKAHEATRPAQHPVGMTAQFPSGTNPPLFESPADWISPVHDTAAPYQTDPPPATGAKVIVSDTDHLWGIGGDAAWVWKSFTRGLHPIYMDPFDNDDSGTNRQGSPAARRAMGDTLALARRVDLAAMTPRPDLASSRFCLANPGSEYVVYVPGSARVTVDLSAVRGAVAVEWLDTRTRQTVSGETVRGGASRRFVAPFIDDGVLYLKAL